jgi:hypothetical protein
MTPQKAFCTFWGMKLHFSSESYSVLKYGISTKASIAKYDAFTQNQKYRFEWLSSKFADPQDLVYCCIGSEFDSVSVQFDSKEDVLESYLKFKRRREAMSYTLKQNISKYADVECKDYDKIAMQYFIGQYCPEFMLLLNYETDKLETLYNSPNFIWAKAKLLKLKKYQDFFNCKKYSSLLI